MKKYFVFFATVVILLTSCKKRFDELEKNPNLPEEVPASLLLNGIETSIAGFQRPWNLEQRWSQFACCNYNYYGNQEYNWGGSSMFYTTLKNVIKMEEEAKAGGAADVNPYSALGKFLRAYFFYEMTMRVGDIPMKEALAGTDNLTPRYDTQKEVFKQVLVWLEEANTDFISLIEKADNTLSGDYLYNNDLRKWQRAVNSFRLRVLISLSKKSADTDLNVKTAFAAIAGNTAKYPLFTGMGDNLQFVWVNPFNKYPINPDNFGFDATRYNMSSTYIGLLTSLKDPRVFAVADPAGSQIKAGLQPSNHDAFIGASPAEDLADMSTKAGFDNGNGYVIGKYSFYGRYRYYRNYTAENTILLGYPEMCFNIAEAINLGWLTGNAEDWYKKGIEGSIGFYGIKDGINDFYYLKPGGKVTESADYINYKVSFVFNDYYAQPSITYAGNNANGLAQILKQKYLSFFQNSGFQAYYNYRRTGIPDFAKNGPGTGNSGLIPKRFQYPGTERTTNGKNLAEALQRQFNGQDDINASMWIIQ